MFVHVGLDTNPILKKPDKQESYKYGNARKNASLNWKQIDIDRFSDLVGNKGYAFVPGHLKGGLSAECCTEQQIFALDFDDGITIQSVLDRCQNYDLKVCVIYHTLSHKAHKDGRFRIIFITDKLIEDSFVIKCIICMLLRVFPEADSACKDLARVFLGGKKLIHYDPSARLNLVYLINAFRECLNIQGHFGRNAKSFASDTGVFLLNGAPLIGYEHELNALVGEKWDLNFNKYIYKLPDQNSPIFLVKNDTNILLHHTALCQTQAEKKGRRLNLDDISDKCPLLQDFYDGVDLYHDIKFAIIRSLLYIKNGQTKFLETIRKYEGDKKYRKWVNDIRCMKKFGYQPSRCKSFCPYYDKCQGNTIISALSDDHKIYKLSKESYVSIQEAEQQFYDNLLTAVSSDTPGLHLIKGQTGLGKTEFYIKIAAAKPYMKFVIAVPTNKLKKEIYQRMLDNGLSPSEIFMTPSVRDNIFIPPQEQELVMGYHNNGIHTMTKSVMHDLLKKISHENVTQRNEIKKIIAGVKGLSDQRIIITTHAYFIHLPNTVTFDRTVIIDEDILQQFFNKTFQVDYSSLKYIADSKLQGYSEIASTMLSAPCEKYSLLTGIRKTPLSDAELNQLLNQGCTGNFNDLYMARSFIRHHYEDTAEDIFLYFCPTYLNCRKAVIISATLNEQVYKRYFRKQIVTTYPMKIAKYKGHIDQYSYYSLGRRDLRERMGAFAFAKAFFNMITTPVITFKELSTNISVKKDLASVNLHFGNTTGIDELSGKDIAVVGTPFKHPDADKLIAAYLGAKVNDKIDKSPVRRRIEYNGYSFVIPTYKDPILREIQLYGISTELEQSAGRSRLLRNACTVLVLSSFPVSQAEIHTDRYLDDIASGSCSSLSVTS